MGELRFGGAGGRHGRERSEKRQEHAAAASAPCHCGDRRADRGRRSCKRQKRSAEGLVGFVESRTVGEPIMAIVSLHDQRITVYDAQGWILSGTGLSSG